MAKLIKLRGKHAVGDREYAIVDDDAFEYLNQWAWKAKPNGSGTHVYAVRNSLIDGKNVTIRMHREVLRYEGPLDSDHINRNSLDNRSINLRVVTRKQNVANTAWEQRDLCCIGCGLAFSVTQKIGAAPLIYCSDSCRPAHLYVPKPKFQRACAVCSTMFETHVRKAMFCSAKCKAKAKWKRRRDSGTQPPSVLRSAERVRLWRESRRAAGLPYT
jgi:hypothetical protein